MEWYTRKEVADKLGISLNSVYQYAKQEKIKKIEDPFRQHRETRYRKEEVDALAEKMAKQPTGIRPSALAKQLKVPVRKIYTIINENKLQVEKFQIGNGRIGYSISEEVAAQIKEIAIKSLSARGTPTEFYNSDEDIALFQRFRLNNGLELRLTLNEDMEWGFLSQGGTWISYRTAKEQYRAAATYSIHQPNVKPAGYTDLLLPKDSFTTFEFLDFVYQVLGFENIRIRERDHNIALSIKSGEWPVNVPFPESITLAWIRQHVVAGNISQDEEGNFLFNSGLRKTTIQISDELLVEVVRNAQREGKTMSEYIEEALLHKLRKDIQD